MPPPNQPHRDGIIAYKIVLSVCYGLLIAGVIGGGAWGLFVFFRAWRPLPPFAWVIAGVIVVITGFSVSAHWSDLGRGFSKAVHPKEPWLWRRDWASRTIVDDNAQTWLLWAGVLLFGAILYLMIEMKWFPSSENVEASWGMALIPVLFVAALFLAIQNTLRARKFGRTIVRFEQLPVKPGTDFKGQMVAWKNRMSRRFPEGGIVLELTCVQRLPMKASDDASLLLTGNAGTVWLDRRVIAAEAVRHIGETIVLPFSFAIPASVPGTDEGNENNWVRWQLKASAEVPGVDYEVVFAVPVFTEPS